MTYRLLILPLTALLTVAAAPPLDADEGLVQAERRLRACLAASSGDGQGTLEAAVVSARSACLTQIRAVRDQRVIDATAGLAPEAAVVVERRVTRALNNEIAQAIANFSGLPVPHAHH